MVNSCMHVSTSASTQFTMMLPNTNWKHGSHDDRSLIDLFVACATMF